MRPGVTRAHAYDPPRWRRRRAADLRDIAIAYAAAIIVCVAMVAASSVLPHWFFNAHDHTASALRGLLLLASYIGCGGLLIALAIHRMAYWQGTPAQRLPTIRWYAVVFWPVIIGLLLIRLATVKWS
jgi:hypothetical protein